MITKHYVGICEDCTDGKTKYLYSRKPALCQFHYKKRSNERTNIRKQKQVHPTKQKTHSGFVMFRAKKIKQKGNTADQRWYEERWNESEHTCEECGIFLGERLNRMFVSHILGKGAHPALRRHPRNFNILCTEHHQQWEFGKRSEMKIYLRNQCIIQILKIDEKNVSRT